MNKQEYLHWAEVFDSWRVVPRLVLFAYCFWLAHVVDMILKWYFLLPATARGVEASGMASVVITAVTGIAAWVFKIYTENGRSWSDPTVTQSTVVATKTTTNP